MNLSRTLQYLPVALAVCVFTLLLPGTVAGQESGTTPDADPSDVASIDAITTAVYESISGEKGEPRQWDRFRSLFHPSARLIPVQKTRDGNIVAVPMAIEDYISRANNFFVENGFYEKELNRKVEIYGSVAHHFSTYASYNSRNDTEPFARGINSFQLMHDGTRWWVMNIFWQGETPELPIPEEYLGS